MNLAPVRGSYLESYCGASIVAHFARKVRVIRQAKKKSATRGRDSCYSRPRVDDIVKDFWSPQCCFPIIKVLFGIKAVYLRRVFKIQKNICAVLSQIASGEACAHDKRTKREKERPERATSS